MADAGHRLVEQVARALGGRGLAEAQAVEHGDRSRPDGEHVTQDPADAGGGSLERLDGARMVVRLDLERNGQATAHIDRAGVLARTHDHVRPLGGQSAQQLARVLVGAVLGPHQAEHGQLDAVRLPAQALDDQRVFVIGEAELAVARSRRGRRRQRAP